MSNPIINGIMGLCVADALGVPVEFEGREKLKRDPVVNMRSYGTYHQPAGTWSDDTSMTLCLLDSLSRGLDYEDIMRNFLKWYREGAYTPHGTAFDIGNATSRALQRFEDGIEPLKCGGTAIADNGNGSLMRILPLLFHLQSEYGIGFLKKEEAFDIIHNVSALTHAHKRSQLACGIYIAVASRLMDGTDLESAVKQGIQEALEYYKKRENFLDQLQHYERLQGDDFGATEEEHRKSSGYVVDTLEAAIWCLLNTRSYRDCVLKAVNLGGDTDTVAAVAGGLAGLYYGYENIPKEWLAEIARREYIVELCNQLLRTCSGNGI